jgi:hypothetical protein
MLRVNKVHIPEYELLGLSKHDVSIIIAGLIYMNEAKNQHQVDKDRALEIVRIIESER